MENNAEKMRKTVTLVLTEACNLSCQYCYQSDRSRPVMSVETALGIIKEEFEKDDGYEEIVFDFFGGEPFMEFQTLKKCYNYIWDNPWNKKRICFATTNGTLVHGEIQAWLRERKDRMWCGLSIDGTKEMHNTNRSGSFESIDLRFFLDNWPTQTIKMTVSASTLPKMAEGVVFLHEFGFPVAVNLAYGLEWSSNDWLSVLSSELDKLIEYYLANPHITPCSMLSMHISRLASNIVNSSNRWCGIGVHMITYDTAGNVHPCHMFAPSSMGTDKTEGMRQLDFHNDSLFVDMLCENCILLPICPTCYGSNYMLTGSLSKRNADLCRMNKVVARAVSVFEYRKILKFGLDICGSKMDQFKMLKAIERIQTTLDI